MNQHKIEIYVCTRFLSDEIYLMKWNAWKKLDGKKRLRERQREKVRKKTVNKIHQIKIKTMGDSNWNEYWVALQMRGFIFDHNKNNRSWIGKHILLDTQLDGYPHCIVYT